MYSDLDTWMYNYAVVVLLSDNQLIAKRVSILLCALIKNVAELILNTRTVFANCVQSTHSIRGMGVRGL